MKCGNSFRKKLVLLVCGILCMILFTACENANTKSTASQTAKTSKESEESKESTESTEENTQADIEIKDHYLIRIDIKDYGTIKVDLDHTAAPITVENFVKLVNEGFYDGLTFHRIINGFMMQGGDPTGTGTGGSDQTIKGEFKNNGVDNPLQHTRGAISMARSKNPDSASSQFFIVHQDAPHLDGDYACFGYVTEGIEVVDQICENTKVEDRNGMVAPANQPVIEKITLIEE